MTVLEAALGHDPRYCKVCKEDTPQGKNHDIKNCICDACMLLTAD